MTMLFAVLFILALIAACSVAHAWHQKSEDAKCLEEALSFSRQQASQQAVNLSKMLAEANGKIVAVGAELQAAKDEAGRAQQRETNLRTMLADAREERDCLRRTLETIHYASATDAASPHPTGPQ